VTDPGRRLVVRPRAEREAAAAFEWYEGQSAGLGTEFLRAVDAALAAIQRNPAAYPAVRGPVRRHLLRRFPYGVFFVEYPSEIVVLAIVHARRHPRVWPADRES
jgi:plasmid stabilization system protein ParE